MKLIDGETTVVIVTASALEEDHSDIRHASALKGIIDERGGGYPYRRAVVVTDTSWFDAPLLHSAPTIAVGGPGVNGVSGQFMNVLPSVWTDADRVVIQAEMRQGVSRASLWGVDRVATGEAVDAFVNRGWLDEFLDRCWHFRAGVVA